MARAELSRYPVSIDGETALIGTASELTIALDVLQGQHDRIVLQQLAPHLTSVIAGPAGFTSILKSLAPADQIFLIDTLGPNLVEMVRDAAHLRDILAVLAEPAVEKRLLSAIGSTGLRRLIITALELAEVLEWVYGDCDQMVLELIGPAHLRRMITTGHHLSVVLRALDEERQSWLLQQLGWERVSALAAGGRDLAYLFGALPGRLSELLLQRYTRDQLVELIGNARDWKFLCSHLEAAELAKLYDMVGVNGDA